VRAIQIHYQLEPNEIGVAVLGEEDRRILLWEASEGGTGTWIRMVEDPLAWPSIARTALSLCHFDATGADLQAGPNGCVRACYECLLGYQNQRDHRLLNRHLLVDYLQRLQAARWVPAVAGRSYDDQYHWLQEGLDPQSCEGAVLEALYRAHLRLPERCQLAPEPEVAAEADFYYERAGRPGVCVFVDGPQHDQPVRQAHDQAEREELRSRGYRIVVIRCDMPFAEQFARYADVFTPQG
ncbi:MAG: DUF1998 domain-containing protein, partial [Firmicutes bacterium]|nr:DUF1998 domain-containing protein [Bacillota bacterium]